jgi:hypothetical protein
LNKNNVGAVIAAELPECDHIATLLLPKNGCKAVSSPAGPICPTIIRPPLLRPKSRTEADGGSAGAIVSGMIWSVIVLFVRVCALASVTTLPAPVPTVATIVPVVATVKVTVKAFTELCIISSGMTTARLEFKTLTTG